ncbi:hypothetical protein B5M47_01405 [candidate division CPR3 bacterium 4484_211]|uniref:Glyceraldehyde 3-phosphate dehydrogenase NAD(P) binding domain-containing protein n=1 Tax=candidate division CPR3 bacterium 4484_211 TaxID=1968527 RepID=A0A1W9NYL2_UNCC3|nr:MAG: hypothetical protein B5M47_01405 [candidate division CPR3 bacterium 4484_211]
MRLAINGFGRIGRTVLKVILSRGAWGRVRVSSRINHDRLELAAINSRSGLNETVPYLFKYDTVYGSYPAEVGISPDGGSLRIDGRDYLFLAESDPGKLPWKNLGVDVVLECTGAFTEFNKAQAHLRAGAKKVIISANGKGEGLTLVQGTKAFEKFLSQKDNYRVISNASCTTNCASPIIQLLHDHFHVLKAQMITVHAVTSTQSLVDDANKNLRRSRAAFQSIIPQPTGAAVAVTRVIPELEGRVSGSAFRVPVICGSVLEIVAQIEKETTAEEVNQVFKTAAAGELKGIIAVSDGGLVSSDVIGSPASATVDLPLTEVLDLPHVVDENLIKVVAWYDNEYGYACRLVELAQAVL